MRIIAFLLDPAVVRKIRDPLATRPGRSRAPQVSAGVVTASRYPPHRDSEGFGAGPLAMAELYTRRPEIDPRRFRSATALLVRPPRTTRSPGSALEFRSPSALDAFQSPKYAGSAKAIPYPSMRLYLRGSAGLLRPAAGLVAILWWLGGTSGPLQRFGCHPSRWSYVSGRGQRRMMAVSPAGHDHTATKLPGPKARGGADAAR